MKRYLIRFCGTVLGFFTSMTNHANAFVMGDIKYWNCTSYSATEILDTGSYVIYKTARCHNPSEPQSACSKGYISNYLAPLYPECMSGTYDNRISFNKCADGYCCTSGWCNSTGIFCKDSGFFSRGNGCLFVNAGDPAPTICTFYSGNSCPIEKLYWVFQRCNDGYYESDTTFVTLAPAVLPPMSGSGGFGAINNYCSPCPNFMVNADGNTVVPPSPAPNHSVTSTPGISGPTACVGHMNGSMSGTKGTFSIPDGCPYVK